MSNDKKNDSESVKFILLNDYWKTMEYDASKSDIKQVFNLFLTPFMCANALGPLMYALKFCKNIYLKIFFLVNIICDKLILSQFN